jgi:hypothetical protein
MESKRRNDRLVCLVKADFTRSRFFLSSGGVVFWSLATGESRFLVVVGSHAITNKKGTIQTQVKRKRIG